MAAGAAFGLFPIMGCTTPLCVGFSLTGRFNLPLMYAVCVVLTAAKIALIYPFLRIGEALCRATPLTVSLTELAAMWREDWMGVLARFGTSFGHAVLGWAVVLVPAALLVFFVVRHMACGLVDWRETARTGRAVPVGDGPRRDDVGDSA